MILLHHVIDHMILSLHVIDHMILSLHVIDHMILILHVIDQIDRILDRNICRSSQMSSATSEPCHDWDKVIGSSSSESDLKKASYVILSWPIPNQ